MWRLLRPELRTYVTQQIPRTNEALLEAAEVTEGIVVDSGLSDTFEILEAIRRLELGTAALVDSLLVHGCAVFCVMSNSSAQPYYAYNIRPKLNNDNSFYD